MRIKVRNWFEGSERIKSGEVGIEVEVEGSRLPHHIYDESVWRVTTDSSLRNGLEYVLRNPVTPKDVDDCLELLHKAFVENKSKLTESVRTGVHVHINVQDMYITEVINLLCIYYIFEEQLVKYCGESREGNLFCLRMKDAKYMLKYLLDVIENKRFNDLNNDDIRYSSVNLKALRTYGSLEFRSMRTPLDVREISNWCKILLKIKKAAKSYDNPLSVVYQARGCTESFARHIFGEYFDELFKGDVDVTMLKRGLFVAEDIANCVSWNNYDKVPNNPFKRASGGM